jgi:hypothetical protein
VFNHHFVILPIVCFNIPFLWLALSFYMFATAADTNHTVE